jgi:hypothetical protein
MLLIFGEFFYNKEIRITNAVTDMVKMIII